MFNFKELESRYRTDAAFNRLVNLHRRAIEEFGFLPDELRQAAFLAQYLYQVGTAEQVIRTNEEWEKVAEARAIMQQAILKVESL